MVSLLPTKFHEILFGSFRGVTLTNCVTDRRTGQQQYVSPHKSGGRHNNLPCDPVAVTWCYWYILLKQLVSTTPLKLLNRIPWNLVGSKDTISSCAYYQEILIAWIVWELCPCELNFFPKYTTEAACDGQDNNNMSPHKSGGRHNNLPCDPVAVTWCYWLC
jgi:hypothetical protein